MPNTKWNISKTSLQRFEKGKESERAFTQLFWKCRTSWILPFPCRRNEVPWGVTLYTSTSTESRRAHTSPCRYSRRTTGPVPAPDPRDACSGSGAGSHTRPVRSAGRGQLRKRPGRRTPFQREAFIQRAHTPVQPLDAERAVCGPSPAAPAPRARPVAVRSAPPPRAAAGLQAGAGP